MGDMSNQDFVPHEDYPTTKGYAMSGKIMLSAIVILFAVVIVMVCLHLYARWYLLRARRRQLRNRRRRTHIVFYVDPNNPAAANTVTVPATRGLDASVLKSLPVFVYSSAHPESLECAVCLSEFEENEKGRTLVKCNHSFHIDCIDMWFHSHSTCPLCRSPVEPDGLVPENREDEVVVTVNEPVETAEHPSSGSSSGLCSSCKHEEEGTNRGFWSSSSSSSSLAAAAVTARESTSSFGARRKALEMTGGVSIEVPRRNQENLWRSEDEFMTESPASLSYKSPTGGRIRSLKRILSRGLLSPSSGAAGTSCSTGSEFDIERGRDESTPRSRVGTPR